MLIGKDAWLFNNDFKLEIIKHASWCTLRDDWLFHHASQQPNYITLDVPKAHISPLILITNKLSTHYKWIYALKDIGNMLEYTNSIFFFEGLRMEYKILFLIAICHPVSVEEHLWVMKSSPNPSLNSRHWIVLVRVCPFSYCIN